MKHPLTRPRRLRQNQAIRNMVQDTHISPHHLIQPFFITEGKNIKEPIESMPGCYRFSSDRAIKEITFLLSVGVSTIALFPITPPQKRSEDGKESYNPNGLIQNSIKKIKDACPQIQIMADVALDPFTTHGHDGLMGKSGEILNDQTLETLSHQALSLAQSGADIIAPSDMMDGRIKHIRNSLENTNLINVIIMSYAVKYASCLYSPFRSGIKSSETLKTKNKRSYQMNPSNHKEAIIEAELDIAEGADIILVKPGLPYLDIISRLHNKINHPIAAYHTSGEYTMQKLAIDNNFLSADSINEILTSFRRSGASIIITYFAKDFATNYQNGA